MTNLTPMGCVDPNYLNLLAEEWTSYDTTDPRPLALAASLPLPPPGPRPPPSIAARHPHPSHQAEQLRDESQAAILMRGVCEACEL